MSALAMTVSDTLVLARRNLMRIPRQPDLLIAYTIQPVMFVLLFVYVFGGAIQTPGYDYVDFLIPGIIVQTMAFGGFVTAIGLSDDLRKGLIDRFRSLPMSRAAVLTGRTFSDIVLNCLSLVVLFAVGFLAGFGFIDATAGEIVLGIVLLLPFTLAVGEDEVGLGDDPHKALVLIHDGNPADDVGPHQLGDRPDGCVPGRCDHGAGHDVCDLDVAHIVSPLMSSLPFIS
jgi:ABC-type multidrug transport system permease subunit